SQVAAAVERRKLQHDRQAEPRAGTQRWRAPMRGGSRSGGQPINCRDLNELLGFCDFMEFRLPKTRRMNGPTTHSTHGSGARTSVPAATIATPRRGRSDPVWSGGETIRAVARLRLTGACL